MRFIEVIDFFELSEGSILAVVKNITPTYTQDGNMTTEQVASDIYGGEWLLSNPGLNHTVTYSVTNVAFLNNPPDGPRVFADAGENIGLYVVENE